ncbi:right-handed parallel beta-helix repeat-containing protein [Haloarculaceae archaeon H-GB2-1]|nr:right-handed parallel beta-helix repeat-containing protein [Haloarculaceae archaeon H-GB2-1]
MSDTTAIRAGGDEQVTNVTVENVRVKEWNRAVYFANVDGGVVRNADVTGNSFGVFVDGNSNVTLENVTSRRYFVGVYAADGNVSIRESSFSGNETNAIVRESVGD